MVEYVLGWLCWAVITALALVYVYYAPVPSEDIPAEVLLDVETADTLEGVL